MDRIVIPQTVNHLEGVIFKEGTLRKEFVIDGSKRTFSYYIPAKVKKGANIIILAHGSYCNGEIMRVSTAYEFEKKAEKNNSIIVYPDAYGPYWNDGRLGRMHIAREQEIDEVKFFRKIIDYMTKVYGGSQEKVYFGGFSNGGALGYKLSQERIFKKMVFWCINLPSPENRDYLIDKRPPIMLINNKEDRMVPFEGGDLLGADGLSRGRFESTYRSFMEMTGKDKLPEGTVKRLYTEYRAGESSLIVVNEGGHTIPHPDTFWPINLGTGSKFNSIELVWKFFEIEE